VQVWQAAGVQMSYKAIKSASEETGRDRAERKKEYRQEIYEVPFSLHLFLLLLLLHSFSVLSYLSHHRHL